MIMTIDIGGTKTLCSCWKNGRVQNQEKFQTASMGNLTAAVIRLAEEKHPRVLAFALAGPVTEGAFRLTNTGQELSFEALKAGLPHLESILLLNDLEASAYSIPHLGDSGTAVFRSGKQAEGNSVILSLGTGLGAAAITRKGEVLASEGGHADFAPQNPQQKEILARLETRFEHVSCERLLSGQGLANIHEALTGLKLMPREITEQAGMGGKQALRTMQVFTDILGAVCGNFALTFLAKGGIYLGGGIIPKTLPLLDKDAFETAFLGKGRLRGILQDIPVYVILDETAPSLGAAVCAGLF